MSQKDNRLALIFERQWLHIGALALLVAGAFWAAQKPLVQAGSLWGIATISWFWIAIFIAVFHQTYVWFVWRSELHAGLMTKVFGPRAFKLYATGFAIIGISRVVSVWLLAIANQGGLDFYPLAMKIVAVAAIFPVIYLFYSVRRYFSFQRAFGIDHFDPATRDLPFIRQGIFRFTPNSMYVFGFLIAWIPALWWASPAAYAAALFNHLYIWIHYFATEKPDFRHIYGPKQN